MAKKYHDPFKNGMSATRPGFGVDYGSPFPKNGFVDHVIMKEYPSEGQGDLNCPYNSMKDIDALNGKSRRQIVSSAKGRKGPF